MPRCSSCNKFVSLDDSSDADVGTLEIDEEGNISGDAHIENQCGDCGQEVTEADLELEGECKEAGEHVASEQKGLHEVSVEEEGQNRTQRSTGKGRGCRTFYGVEVECLVSCSCGATFKSVTAKGEVQASGMDECG